MGLCVYSLSISPVMIEMIYTLSYHHQIGSMNYYPLFRVRSWNNGVRCMSIFLWICDMAGLLRGTFVSWRYLPRIWPFVTDMQNYYHARYPADDWHQAYIFSLVYFSVEVCLVGVFPHSVSTWRDPCVRFYVPLTLLPPSREIKIEGVTGSLLEPSEGAFELTHGSARIDGWKSGLLDILIFPYIAQFMRCVMSKIHYGLKVVSCFRHFTASHYHHDTRLLTGVERM